MSCALGSLLSPLSPNGCLSSANNTTNVGGGGAENPNNVMKPSAGVAVPGYKWRLVIAYDGTQYAGWQFQQSPPTIQCIVEKALIQVTKLERKDLQLVGASRTDTGVHAWGQVAHFVTPFNYDSLESIHAALNGLLPSDIRIREISAAGAEFHARFSAISKVYHYKIYNDAIMDPFQWHYAYHSAHKLNTAVMREGAKHFIGRHDFSAFANASRNDRVPNPVKTIFRFDVNEMGTLLQLEVEGSGFLYRQVRNMVALLLQIGKEAIPPDIVAMILATRDRKELAKYALAAPPHGLCLVSIKYNEKLLQLPAYGTDLLCYPIKGFMFKHLGEITLLSNTGIMCRHLDASGSSLATLMKNAAAWVQQEEGPLGVFSLCASMRRKLTQHPLNRWYHLDQVVMVGKLRCLKS